MAKAVQKNYVAHQGAPYRFGNEIFILAPLALADYEQALAESRTISESSEPADMIGYAVRVVFGSLRRNYPKITTESVRDMLDTWSMNEAVAIIMTKTGMICEPTDEVPSLEKYRELVAAQSE